MYILFFLLGLFISNLSAEEISKVESQPNITSIQAYALAVQPAEKTDALGNSTPSISIQLYLRKGYKDAQGAFVAVGNPVMITWDKSELPVNVLNGIKSLRETLVQLAATKLGGTYVP